MSSRRYANLIRDMRDAGVSREDIDKAINKIKLLREQMGIEDDDDDIPDQHNPGDMVCEPNPGRRAGVSARAGTVSNRCVSCGAEVPEGVMVCVQCELQSTECLYDNCDWRQYGRCMLWPGPWYPNVDKRLAAARDRDAQVLRARRRRGK